MDYIIMPTKLKSRYLVLRGDNLYLGTYRDNIHISPAVHVGDTVYLTSYLRTSIKFGRTVEYRVFYASRTEKEAEEHSISDGESTYYTDKQIKRYQIGHLRPIDP